MFAGGIFCLQGSQRIVCYFISLHVKMSQLLLVDEVVKLDIFFKGVKLLSKLGVPWNSLVPQCQKSDCCLFADLAVGSLNVFERDSQNMIKNESRWCRRN